MRARRRALWIAIGLTTLLLHGIKAEAVEYRLLVASVFEDSMTALVSARELNYGASGPGLQRLDKMLDTGEIPLGAMPPGRGLSSVPDSVARAWSAVGVQAPIARGSIDSGRWDEVRWQGNPGERSIFVVRPVGGNRPQSIRRLTFAGSQPVRQYQPFTFSGSERLAVLQMPQSLIEHYESRGNIWDKWVRTGLNLDQGIGAVVGRTSNALSADLVYLIVQQGDQPTTYRVVVAWSDRSIDREGRGDEPIIMQNGRH